MAASGADGSVLRLISSRGTYEAWLSGMETISRVMGVTLYSGNFRSMTRLGRFMIWEGSTTRSLRVCWEVVCEAPWALDDSETLVCRISRSPIFLLR